MHLDLNTNQFRNNAKMETNKLNHIKKQTQLLLLTCEACVTNGFTFSMNFGSYLQNKG